MTHQSSIRSVLSGFALTMMVAAAYAQPGAASASSPSNPNPSSYTQSCDGQRRMQSGGHLQGDFHRMHSGKRMSGHGQGGIPGVGQLPASLIEELALTDKQKVALLDAQTAAKGMQESRKQLRNAHRESIRQSANQESFDPRVMIEQQNKMRESMQASRDAVQKKWLSFWDGLSKEQQAKVSAFMKQKMTQRANRPMGARAG